MNLEWWSKLDSTVAYRHFWSFLRILGVAEFRYKALAQFYVICLTLFVTVYCPIHLLIGLLMLTDTGDFFKNFSMTVTSLVCSLKYFFLRLNLNKISQVIDIYSELDKRASTADECEYFIRHHQRKADSAIKILFLIYMGTNSCAFVAAIVDQRLMFPAWFPFDWKSSSLSYWSALLYQFIGVNMLIVHNVLNDTIGPMSLCLLSGHVRLLAMRVARIGYNKRKSPKHHEDELKLCIEDHHKLLKAFKLLESSISWLQFILFFTSGLNICLSVVNFLFYSRILFDYIYYASLVFSLSMQVFPCYFYGSALQEEFKQLPYAMFANNWVEQSRNYRQDTTIFVEIALKSVTMLAGGIVEINLNSFFAIYKAAYSIFTNRKRLFSSALY
uniref:Odorant receptor n=1 Tax=Glossina palpalis gambiensis TaxID=67801 RepID=A0A1B0AYX4_9MUSC